MKMKRLIGLFLLPGLAALLLAVSCEKFRQAEDVTDTRGTGTLTLKLNFPDRTDPATRLDDYTDTESGELNVGITWVLVYGYSAARQDWVLESCLSSFYGLSEQLTAQLTPGNKKIGVVVSPSYDVTAADFATYSDFSYFQYDIREFEGTGNNYFQMQGEGDCTITAGQTTSCEIEVSHVCARVTLACVRNATSSDIIVKRAWLSNVARYYNAINGDTTPASDFLNIQGRSDRTQSHIILGSACGAAMKVWTYSDDFYQTLSAGGEISERTFFYCYQNESTNAPDGYTSSYDGEYTTLVVVASVGGTDYYYPIVFDPAEMTGATYSIERNKAYTVGLTIAGPGSDDPNNPVTKVAASFTVDIADWGAGPVYDQRI